MTNYNEKLDEVIKEVVTPAWLQQVHETTDVPAYQLHLNEAKQAITSLIKELVEEAKPGTLVDPDDPDDLMRWQGYVDGVIDFKRNLLKELEEV